MAARADHVDERLALAKASPAGLALYADPRRFKLPPHLALLNRAITEAIAEIVTLSAVVDETGEEDRIGPRVMVFMPPRHGKSLLTSQYTPAYFLGAFPHLEVIVASYMQDLATDWGRKSREILEAHGPAVFGAHIQQTARAASRWLTTAGGGYRASGAGSSITGRGANLFIIDDPLKDQEQAQSQLIRDKQWEWYLSTVRTRLMPGGGIFLIMCMTGDTPVLMGDGTEKPLRDVRPGDTVATYENGTLTAASVRNWANQGPDIIYEVRMKSGRRVRANARHPFRVIQENGTATWLRLGSLRVGMRVRSFEAPTQVSNAPSTGVTPPRSARACACPTTARRATPQDIGLPRPATPADARFGSRDAMGSRLRTMTGSSQGRVDDVLSVGSAPKRSTGPSTGPRSSASTTTTTRERCEACSATTAISSSAERARYASFKQPLSTWRVADDEIIEIVEAGTEDVFDIEVERTHNFVANGLEVSNTRWHEDDLAGRLLKQMRDEPDAEQWKVLCLPAVAEPPWDGETREGHPLVPPQGDLLGREPGEALWPGQYGHANLAKIESTIGIFWWSALYQQRPAPAEGFLFKRRDFRRYQEIEGGVDGHQAWKVMRTEVDGGDYIVRRIDVLVFSTIDVAASEKETADYTVVTTWAYTAEADLLVLDVRRERFEGPTQVELVKASHAYWDHAFIGVERNLYGAELIKQTRRRGLPVRKLEADTDKITRALPAAVRYQGHQVFHPVHAPWLDDFEAELLAFPNAAHDDQVDTVAYAVKLLPDLSVGAAPQKLSDGPQEADRYGPLSRGLDTSDV